MMQKTKIEEINFIDYSFFIANLTRLTTLLLGLVDRFFASRSIALFELFKLNPQFCKGFCI